MKPLLSNQLRSESTSLRLSSSWPVGVIALLGWISIVVSLDPGGSYPNMPEGPGLTIDEIFNVEQGVYLAEQAKRLGWLNLIPGTSQEAYRVENGYNPDHPPLGRWWLGLHHNLTWLVAPPYQPDGPSVTACARTGSATAFALTVFMIGWFGTAWWGRAAGVMSAISLVMMPRVYGHAHLASLETITNLTCTAAVLLVADFWNGPSPPSKRAAMLSGAFFGLALLTKIQAILIPIPLVCWAVWRWRSKAFLPIGVWGLTAIFVFFACWPYLWEAPIDHISEYLGRTTNRATIHVWYFGQRYADKNVPWHYPFVLFALTVPAILHLLGLLGLFFDSKGRTKIDSNEAIIEHALLPLRNGHINNGHANNGHAHNGHAKSVLITQNAQNNADRQRDVLLLSCAIFPLIVFALPGVAVYDGERLFLTSFPLWAMFVGRGWIVVWRLLSTLSHRPVLASALCSVLLLIEASPLVTMAPCHLSYFNGITPFFTGSDDRTEMEVDYWGEGITRRLLRRLVESVPEGATVAIAPTLHQFQADDYRRQSPILRAYGVKIVEFQPEESASRKFLLVFRRRADLASDMNITLKHYEILETTTCGGYPLAFLLQKIK